MFLKLSLRSLISFCLLSIVYTSDAQPLLPDVAGMTEKGINILSWQCQYDGIKSIAVQRSGDSVFNYVTIGYIKKLKKGPQAFIDGHPNPGNNWYRLYIVFNSDLTWYSNRTNLWVDSVTIANKGVLPPNDSLQKLAENFALSMPDPSEINAYTYIKSQYVFTNPFTGHVNIELPDVTEQHYSVSFYNEKERKIFDVKRITESPIILDKRNFPRKGLFKFDLFKNKKKLETGYITIY